MKPRPRPLLALVLLGVFVYISASLLPTFLQNLRLQRYMEELTHSSQIRNTTSESVRAQVVDRARQLGLPVRVSDVQVDVSGPARISARYLVQVDLPGYTVKLHFAPSAGK